jgi:hypothetical protein
MGKLPPCSVALDFRKCGYLTGEQAYLGLFDEDGSPANVVPDDVARRLAKLLAATRTQTSVGGEAQLVGVDVNYNVSLTGFRGRKVSVRWSLHRVSGDLLAQHEWLKEQPFRWLTGEADNDFASDEFWVPLPKVGGPFYVGLALYDDDGVRLDYKRSPHFQ